MSMSSDVIGPKLLEILGLPSDRCRFAKIQLRHNEPVKVYAEYYASMEPNAETGELETEVRRFTLVEDEQQ